MKGKVIHIENHSHHCPNCRIIHLIPDRAMDPANFGYSNSRQYHRYVFTFFTFAFRNHPSFLAGVGGFLFIGLAAAVVFTVRHRRDEL